MRSIRFKWGLCDNHINIMLRISIFDAPFKNYIQKSSHIASHLPKISKKIENLLKFHKKGGFF